MLFCASASGQATLWASASDLEQRGAALGQEVALMAHSSHRLPGRFRLEQAADLPPGQVRLVSSFAQQHALSAGKVLWIA